MADWKKSFGPAVELEGPWYNDPLLKRLSKITDEKIEDFAAVLNEARGHYERELELYKNKRNTSSKSESKWIKTVFQSGTSVDKINAHALLISESPVHNLSSVRSLIGLIELKVRRQCMQAVDALLQAFTETLLPNSRKLVPFSKQNLSGLSKLNKNERRKALVLFVFEEELKIIYDLFIKDIGKLLKDPVDIVKRKGIACLEVLLAHSPEQEQELLSQLVNKIGDPQRAVAAFAVSHLETLLRKHPNMKLVVVSEVERVLYRPNVTSKAQYFGLCFLNQILLSEGDSKLATKLVLIYISFFKACIKKNEVSSKIMSALLAGVNRAYPFAQGGDASSTLAPHLDTLYKLVHISQFNISVQALCLLYRAETVGTAEGPSSDRFYSALYKKLLDRELGHSNKMSMLLNLLFRSLKADEDINRVRAFLKRLLQVGQQQSPGLLCGILYLISELFKAHPELSKKPTKKVADFGNSDSAFSDEEEHYEDVPLEESDKMDVDDDTKPTKVVSSWVHRQNVDSKKEKLSSIEYDPNTRNPAYAHAETCNYWELNSIRNHYHPSVSLFSKTVLEGRAIDYTGDPLQDFQLIRFLDRFVFRNPKAVESENPNRRVLGRRHLYQPKGARNLAVNSEDYLNYDISKVPVDELVFYKYFSERAKTSEGKKPDDLESLSDDEFDDYLQSMTMANFADELKEQKTAAKKGDGEDANEGSDADFDDDDDDDEPDFEEDPEFNAQFEEVEDILGEDQSGDEFDEENFGSDDDFLDEVAGTKKSKKVIKEKASGSDFANADDFADILEQNAEGLDVGTSEQILNADKANWKQLKWEQNRAQQMKSDKWRSKKKDVKGKRRNFGKVKQKPKGKGNFVKSKRK